MPDGTIIRGVPEGTSRAELDEKLGRYQQQQAGPDPEEEAAKLRKAQAQQYAGEDTSKMGAFQRGLGGAKAAWDKAAMGLKGVFTDLTPEDKALLEQGEAFTREGGTAAKVGGVAGDIAIQAPLAFTPGGLPTQMAVGAAFNALTTPGDAEDRAKAGGLGAVGALGGHVLSRTLGRIAKPIGTKAADTLELEARGVEPTFGQAMAQKGGALPRAIGKVEENLQSVPLASGPLTRARERTMEQWRAATRAESRAPGAAGATPDDLPGLRAEWNQRYTSVLDSEPLPYSSVQYQPDMRKLSAGIAVSREQRQMAQDMFEQTRLAAMSNPTPGVQATASAAHGVESDIKTAAANYINSADPAQRDFGRLLGRLARDYGDAWRGGLRNPSTRNEIRQLDRAYAPYKAVQRAGQRVGVVQSAGDPSNYTPTALLQASRAIDRSPGKRAFEARQAPMQELARLGQTLANRVPDSGSAQRIMAGAAALGASSVNPSTLLSLVGLYGYGSRPVQQYLTGRAAPQAQQAIMEFLQALAPLLAQTGSAAAAD